MVEYIGPRDGPVFQRMVLPRAGTDVTFTRGRLTYDPKYGLPESLEDMSAEHRASVEDALLSFKVLDLQWARIAYLSIL